MKFLSKIIGALFLVVVATTANANLITNGGFETGDLTDWTCIGSCAAQTSYVHTGSYGSWSFDNSGTGSLTQTFSTTIGGLYDFSFWMNTNTSAITNVFSYSMDGGSIIALSPSFSTWSFVNDSFVATGLTAEIAFYFETTPGSGSLILDDIVATQAVPEPASIAIFGLGLLGLFLTHKRKVD